MTEEMTENKYRKMSERFKKDFLIKQRALDFRYAMQNNTVEKSDIIEDCDGKGRVLDITLSVFSDDLPFCAYWVINLTKDGEVSKREPKRFIHQCNLINDNKINEERFGNFTGLGVITL